MPSLSHERAWVRLQSAGKSRILELGGEQQQQKKNQAKAPKRLGWSSSPLLDKGKWQTGGQSGGVFLAAPYRKPTESEGGD